MSDEFMGELRLGTVRELLSAQPEILSNATSLLQQLRPREGAKRDKAAQGNLNLSLRLTADAAAPLSASSEDACVRCPKLEAQLVEVALFLE